MTANQLTCSRHVERLRAMATSAWPCVPVRSLSVPVLTCMFTLLVLSQANIAFAQSAQLPAPPAASTPAAPSNAPQPRAPELRIVPTQARPMPNDPTMPSPEIRSLLDGEKTNANAAPNAPPPNPTIRLRARVIAKGKPGLAIIDVGGSTITVRQGDEINVTAGAGSVPIVITKLTATDLQVEIGSRRQPLNLN